MPITDILDITRIEKEVDGDTKFPYIDPGQFLIVEDEFGSQSSEDECPFRFQKYVNRENLK